MKKSLSLLAAGVLVLTLASCGNNNNNRGNNQNAEVMEANGNAEHFPLGDRGPSEWFVGEVYVQGLVSPDQMEGLYNVGQVTFMPGGRTYWHTHPIGQTLLVLEGKGWYQERGKPAQALVKGSVVPIPKDVEHWHGAAADSKFVHIAITNMMDGNNVTWTTPVIDQEYQSVQGQ